MTAAVFTVLAVAEGYEMLLSITQQRLQAGFQSLLADEATGFLLPHFTSERLGGRSTRVSVVSWQFLTFP